MVNLKVKVIKPRQGDLKNGYASSTHQELGYGREEGLIIYEQIMHIPESENLEVFISTDAEIRKFDVFVENNRVEKTTVNGSLSSNSETSVPNGHARSNQSDMFKTPEIDVDNDDEEFTQVESLPDDDLRRMLKSCNVMVGPIVDSTRKMYQNRLSSLIRERKSLRKMVPEEYKSSNTNGINKSMRCANSARITDSEPTFERNITEKDEKAGFLARTFLFLLKLFVTIIKIKLSLFVGFVAYHLVFESD